MKRIFLFITPDGVTYSSPEKLFPDVDNLQVLGSWKGKDEEDALRNFLRINKWVFSTDFEEVICIEINREIMQGKTYFISEFYDEL